MSKRVESGAPRVDRTASGSALGPSEPAGPWATGRTHGRAVRSRTPLVAGLAVAVATGAVVAGGSEEKQGDSGPKAEKQEKGSDEETLNELLGLPTSKSKKRGSSKQPDGQKDEAKPFRALQPKGMDRGPTADEKVAKPRPASLFGRIVADIGSAAEKLRARNLGVETLRVQKRAIDRLDQLISKMSKRQRQKPQGSQGKPKQQSAGSKKNQSQQRAGGSTRSKRPASAAGPSAEAKKGKAAEGPLSERLAEWGNLPPRLRKKLMQGVDEDFSSLYRSQTEAYYQRLAEEQQSEQ